MLFLRSRLILPRTAVLLTVWLNCLAGRWLGGGGRNEGTAAIVGGGNPALPGRHVLERRVCRGAQAAGSPATGRCAWRERLDGYAGLGPGPARPGRDLPVLAGQRCRRVGLALDGLCHRRPGASAPGVLLDRAAGHLPAHLVPDRSVRQGRRNGRNRVVWAGPGDLCPGRRLSLAPTAHPGAGTALADHPAGHPNCAGTDRG